MKLGDTFGHDWIVRDGVKPGERVVVEGLQKVRPGHAGQSEAVRGEVISDVEILYQPSDCGDRDRDLYGDRGRGGRDRAAGSPVPPIAPPEVQVTAIYVGADAQTIEQSVATPIEQQMSGVDNMNYMYSLNATANGQMRMIVDFDVATDPNTDLILAQSRETQAASQLPADVTNYGVTVQKSVLAPLMVVALYSPKGTHDARFLANYAYINLNDQLTRVKGVGTVQCIRRRSVRHAPLGKARPTGEAADHRPGNRLGHPDAEHRKPRRAGGSEPIPHRAAVHLLRARSGPPDDAGGVREDCGPRNSRHRDRPRRATWREWN